METTEKHGISVVGGVYEEHCLHPSWNEIFGSAGRAASAIAALGTSVTLHSHLDKRSLEVLRSRGLLENFDVVATDSSPVPRFEYFHGLDEPRIYGLREALPSINVKSTNVVCFGTIDATAIVDCDSVVYDPQNPRTPQSFSANGSSATKIALILNRNEARLLSGALDESPSSLARALLSKNEADVVVLKLGALGVLVNDGETESVIPAFRSPYVWKIGTGDYFTAAFAHYWLIERQRPSVAATLASIGTSYYAETRGFATPDILRSYSPVPVNPSERFRKGWRPRVYLAGPFFTLGQTWIVEQASNALRDIGLDVFSPYHDIGHGSANDVVNKDLEALDSCDLVFAIADGMDSGTMFEAGYSRALSKPVVVYCERGSDEECKMMLGSSCTMRNDFVTAVYEALWTSCEL